MAENGSPGGENTATPEPKPPKPDLILLLATGATVREAAQATGLSERTVYRRLTDDGIRQAVRDVRAELISTATGRLAENVRAAADTLARLLGAEKENVQRLTAVSLIEAAIKLREHGDLTDEVRKLREEVDALKAAQAAGVVS